jgi:phasin family protein
MSPLTEQFSEARKLQLETQFNFFHTFTGQAFESAEKLIALNFDVSRASLEKSSALMRQMISARDPRDLLALTSQTQSQFDSVLAYGRRLFGIAAGAPGDAGTSAAAVPTLSLVPPAAEAAPAAGEAHAVAKSVAPAPEAVVASESAVEPDPEPIAEQDPIARAAGARAELPKPSAASFPVPSSSKPIAVAPVKPVEAEPPHAPVSGTPEIVTKQAAATPSKPARKK